nr:hypothetical protein [Tanacetum cinerariifolium]
MVGSSSQPCTDPAMSPINAPIEDLYTPEFLESLQENTEKKLTRNWQKRTIQSDNTPRQTAWTTEKEIALLKLGVPFPKTASMESGAGDEDCIQRAMIHYELKPASHLNFSGEASINLNTNVGDNNEDEVQKIRRPGGRDKARAAGKNKWSKASGSSTVNEDALARLMVTEMTTQKKEERLAFIEIKRREVECREREVAAQEYRAQQEDTRFYLQPYDHLTGDQPMAMDEARAKIKAKYYLQY